MTTLSRIGVVVLAGIAAVVAAAAIGTRTWRRTADQLVRRLDQSDESAGAIGSDVGGETFDPRRLDGLPTPVGRYFTFALTPGQPLVRRAELRFTGTFASKPDAWAPFTAEQHVRATPPGFVWEARIRMIPLVPVFVRDSYVGGEGSMRGAIASLIPVVDQHGTREMAAASLQRFLAEAVWLPTSLLPRNGLGWSAIDDSTARVTLTDGPTTVSLDVRFGERGEITGVSTDRYRDVKGTPVLTRWVGTHTDYKRLGGMMIPTAGEVAWILPEGPAPYWRGSLVEAKFER
jgi:hypothetical protein